MGAWVWFEMALAEIARDTGRAHEAIRRFRAVAETAPSVGQEAVLIWAHVGVAQGYLLLGECGPAAIALQRADDVGDSPVATSYMTRERTRAWLDACRGDLVTARERIREVAKLARRDQIRSFEASTLNDLVRLGVPAEAVDRLGELVHLVDGPLVHVHAAHAVAAAERDVGRYERVIDGYEELDVLGLAAEAAAELADLHRAAADTAPSRRRPAAIGGAGGSGRRPRHARTGSRCRRRATDEART